MAASVSSIRNPGPVAVGNASAFHWLLRAEYGFAGTAVDRLQRRGIKALPTSFDAIEAEMAARSDAAPAG
jgi:hypothetical protein